LGPGLAFFRGFVFVGTLVFPFTPFVVLGFGSFHRLLGLQQKSRTPGERQNTPKTQTKMFKQYYQKHLKQPFQCPDCHRLISSKSNLSKHRATRICRNSRGEM